jgi:SAM-dependent methyltransferase
MMNDSKSTLAAAPDNKGDERRGHQAGTTPAFAEKSKKGSYQWDAADYASHSGAQQQWARELTARLALSGREDILDIGCGDGKVTAELATLVPEGSVTGVDSSKARTCKRFCVNSFLGQLNDRHSIFKNDSKLIQG